MFEYNILCLKSDFYDIICRENKVYGGNMMKKNIIKLTEEQISAVIKEWSEECAGKYEDGCLCGYYECYVEGVGYLTIQTHCRRSNGCPDGMSWIVNDEINVWNSSFASYGYIPEGREISEDDSIELIGYLDKSDVDVLRQVVRKSIMRDYSPWNMNEYGISDDGDIMNIKNEEVSLEYAAYVESGSNAGFVHYEYGQGEQLLFLEDSIENADFFNSKESILEELSCEDLKIDKIKYYEKKITVIEEICQIED